MLLERSPVVLQEGIWIDSRWLAVAGLRQSLEITVEPGEIRIRAAESSEGDRPISVEEIEDAYPLIDEAFRENWEAPGMEEYDTYE